MILTLDVETRSRVDLRTYGVYVYAKDPSTKVMCLSAKVDENPADLWVGKEFQKLNLKLPTISSNQLQDLVNEADTIVAHNVMFERLLWTYKMQNAGLFEIAFSKWRDTAAKAAMLSLPRNLAGVGEALNLSSQKDLLGHKIMMKLCKPNTKGKWVESPEDFNILCRYCMKDADTEYELHKKIGDLPDSELSVWRLDQIINDRGIQVDINAVKNLIYKVEWKKKMLLREVRQITGGYINSTNQGDATIAWLGENGIALTDITKNSVAEALKNPTIPENAKRLLEIRQALSKSSVAKLYAMKRMCNEDNRVRGTMLYHGAGTGRFSGKGIQPHNYPREGFEDKDINNVVCLGLKDAEKRYGNIMQVASKCLRGMIVSKPGYNLVCADFSSIEARVLAWVAGEDKVLQAFQEGKDLYKVTAAEIYDKQYEDVTKEERSVGKTAVLALGYQGWVGAFRVMAENYGIIIPEEEAIKIIMKWREKHKKTVRFWKCIDYVAKKAIETGEAQSYGRIKFGINNDFLHCRLPSGRIIYYYLPELRTVDTKYEKNKEVVSFMGADATTKKWQRQYTYGGKLTENIVQGIARDLLTDAMLRIEANNFPVTFHVHDEIVSEMPEGQENLKRFKRIMAEVPYWAEGCPMGASGWIGKRYRKD